MLDECGLLHIIDRKCNMLELYINGRSVWVSPSILEEAYSTSPLIRNIVVHGDRTQDSLIAIVVPATSVSFADMYHDILCSVRDIGRKYRFKPYEIPKALIISDVIWMATTGELSSTGKPRRAAIISSFKTKIDSLYAKLAHLKPHAVEDYLDYQFVGFTDEDTRKLTNLYADIRKRVLNIRKLRPEIARARVSLEFEAKEKIATEKRTRLEQVSKEISKITFLSGSAKTAAIEEVICSFYNMKVAVQQSFKNFLAIKDSSDPVLVEEFSNLSHSLEQLSISAQEACVDVPYQISSGGILLPPARMQKEGVIPEGPGFPNWQVWCYTCGDLIEWGSEGEGTERYHCLDCQSIDHCKECFSLLTKLREMCSFEHEQIFTSFDPHIALHETCLENAHTVWLRDKVVPANSKPSPAAVVISAGKQYANRLCLGMPHILAQRSAIRDVPGISFKERDGYQWLTYSHTVYLASALATGLRAIGIPRGSFIGICGPNSFEWIISDFACALAGCRPVGIHTTFDVAQLEGVFKTADIVAVLCSADSLTNITKASLQCSSIRHIITFENSGAENSFLRVIQIGLEKCSTVVLEDPEEQPPGGPESLYTLLFTSGSTAIPKAGKCTLALFIKEFK